MKEYEETLSDEYYDTESYDLLKSDHWLRKRNGDWELKYPVGSTHESGNTLYHETSNLEDIMINIGTLSDLLKGDLLSLMKDRVLTCFAHLETKRWCYKKDEVNIVIDLTDWGFRVGEVEIMVSSKDQVPGAVKKIEQIAEDLSKFS